MVPISPAQVSPGLYTVELTLPCLSWKCFVQYLLEIYLTFSPLCHLGGSWASDEPVPSFLLPSGHVEPPQKIMDCCVLSSIFSHPFLLLQSSRSANPFCGISQSSSPLIMLPSLPYQQNLFVPAWTTAGSSPVLGVSCQQSLLSSPDPPFICNHFQFNEKFLILY